MPVAMGRWPPAVPYATNPSDASKRPVEPLLPPLLPVALPQSSAMTALGSMPLASAWPWLRWWLKT